jgi:Delta7-sterol 5-desaturase
MIASRVLSLVETIVFVYLILVAAYFATGLTVSWLVGRISAQKIQDRRAPREQILRDLKQSIQSLAVIAGMFGLGQWMNEVLGWGFRFASSNWLQTALSLAASLVIFDTWFYWLHRLLHTKPFYRRIHMWHHQTTTPEVWSNNSDLMLDNFFLQSYWLVAHFILPIAPGVLLAHKLYDQITGVIGHSGYELAGLTAWPPSPLLSATHHDQHHRYVRCNFGTHFTLWDRLMGTLHPRHDVEVRRNIGGGETSSVEHRATHRLSEDRAGRA